jgi:hypothetical protein
VLSYGARLTLLKACLASIPIYLMYIVKFPKWAINALNSQMAIFWDDTADKHRYHLSNIQSLCQRKDQGGLGIPDLRNLNCACWLHGFRGIMIVKVDYGKT